MLLAIESQSSLRETDGVIVVVVVVVVFVFGFGFGTTALDGMTVVCHRMKGGG